MDNNCEKRKGSEKKRHVISRRAKSRSGCKSCKKRKVKCDEAQPACKQCVKQKLECPGYQQVLQWKSHGFSPQSGGASTQDRVTQHPPEKRRSSHTAVTALSPSSGTSSTISTYCGQLENYPLVINSTSHQSSPVASPVISLLIMRTLDDPESQLVGYYFSRTCVILSSFDSYLNPFRTLVASMIHTSDTMRLLVQAMGAIHMSSGEPAMKSKALSLQSQAFQSARNDISCISRNGSFVGNDLILSIILLGLTSAWFNVNDSGASHMAAVQALIPGWTSTRSLHLDNSTSFILGAAAYTRMLASFIDKDPECSLDKQDALLAVIKAAKDSSQEDNATYAYTTRSVPNPITGYSAELFLYLGEVGALGQVRQIGKLRPQENCFTSGHMQRGQRLETCLLDLDISGLNVVDSLFDDNTPVDHILMITAAYRLATLLQLYTTIPELLQQPLPSDRTPKTRDRYPAPGGDGWMEFIRLRNSLNSDKDIHSFLREIAFRAARILRDIPKTSGSRSIQMILLLITGSWMVYFEEDEGSIPIVNMQKSNVVTRRAEDGMTMPCSDSQINTVNTEGADPVAYWRNFINERMSECKAYIGLEPLTHTQQLMEEVWRCNADRKQRIDWITVMTDKGLETMMG